MSLSPVASARRSCSSFEISRLKNSWEKRDLTRTRSWRRCSSSRWAAQLTAVHAHEGRQGLEPQEGHGGDALGFSEAEEPLHQPIHDHLRKRKLLVDEGLEDEVLDGRVADSAALENGRRAVGVGEGTAGQDRGDDFGLFEDGSGGLQEGEEEAPEEGGRTVECLGNCADDATGRGGS